MEWRRGFGRPAAGLLGLSMLAGCAAPGPPLPPTLNLPQVVTAASLSAVRVGDGVVLHWTTPSQTTDKLLTKGGITAVLCREAVAAPARQAARPRCQAVLRLKVMPGASEATDALPAELAVGAPRLLEYRVQLENAAGRTAGPSPAVYAAAGSAPAAVVGFSASAARGGILLRWTPQPGAATVELHRMALEAAAQAGGKPAAEANFRAGDGAEQAGGTLDRSAEPGREYSYTAQRVAVVQLGGRQVELRSAATPAVRVTLEDVFPPDTPAGLAAAPGFTEAQQPAIDLSWTPVIETESVPRLAGYRVYRREGTGEWKRIGPELVREPDYRDAAVAAGVRYEYRVTSVSTAGAESLPSATAAETAPTQ